MGLNYRNLDNRTRKLMVSEIDRDIHAESLFLSDNLNPDGRSEYPLLIRAAAESGSDDTLANEIRTRLNSHEKPRMLASGKLSKPPVMRSNAHVMLAEGEFNRFYIRALCVRALEDGISHVTVYRAKEVQNPRAESQRRVGTQVRPDQLLNDLRTRPGVDTALGLPAGPNSGLSVFLS